jgi:hypothetical protein
MSKFHRGCTYRHATSGDLDIYVISVPYFNESKSKLKIHWVDKRNGKIRSFPGDRVDGVTNIEIQATDYQHWSKVK